MNALPTVTELLRDLVQIPSVNPSGDPGTEGVGEQQCAEYVLKFLENIGAEAELRDVLPGRPNVVARFKSDRPGKPRLLFAPHTDTVSVAGMTIEPFGAEVREGRLWGRGASDTKGTMAAMLHGLARVGAEALARGSHEIWFAGLAGEEAGQQGAKALAAEERFDFVIAGEPTGLDIVHQHKGCTHLRLRTQGKAVHASRPEIGENAIYKMADAIEWIRKTLEPELARCTHPTLGHSTVSLGTIHGGSKINIVPDLCEAWVDIRTVPGAETEAIFFTLAADLGQRVHGIDVTMKGSPALDTPPEHEVIQVLQSLGSRCVGAPWFCDAAVFAQKGVSSIALGPGSIDQAHTEDEWIALDELERGARFFADFLQALHSR